MYTPEEKKARFLRKNGVKLADIVEKTGLSRDRVKEVTRDIWLEQQRRLTEDRALARRLREEGNTLSKIAKKVGHSRDLVTEWVSDIQTPLERDKELAYELRSQGWKVHEIAAKIGRSRSSVVAWTTEISKRKRRELEEKIAEARKLLDSGMPKADVVRQVGIDRTALDRAIGYISAKRKDYAFLASEVNRLYGVGWEKHAIASELGVSIDFVRRHTRKIDDESTVDDEVGVYVDEQGVEYYNCKYLARRLDLARSSLYVPLKGFNVPYRMVCTTSRSNTWQRFYKLEDVLAIPRFKDRLEQVNSFNALPSGHILRRKPGDLTTNQFKVFCILLLWKNQKDAWPTPTQIAGALNGQALSVEYIRQCLGKLEERGYLTTIREKGTTRKRIIIHKGPAELITRQVECAHCDYKFFVARDYVQNGAG